MIWKCRTYCLHNARSCRAVVAVGTWMTQQMLKWHVKIGGKMKSFLFLFFCKSHWMLAKECALRVQLWQPRPCAPLSGGSGVSIWTSSCDHLLPLTWTTCPVKDAIRRLFLPHKLERLPTACLSGQVINANASMIICLAGATCIF